MDNKGSCSMGGKNKGSCDMSMKECYGTLLKGALVGGIMMFAVFMVSWLALPWHKSIVKSFTKEQAVASVLSSNASMSGIYVLPMTSPIAAKAPDTASKLYAFVSLSAMFKQLLLCLLAAAMLTKFLKKMSNGTCCPVACSVKLGFLIGLFAYVPNMIWFRFPFNYSVLGIVDLMVAFGLAGAAISKIVLSNCNK
jgi:hypothetical protein